MPKIVDHDERKRYIAEATWRVIREQGMKGASVRNIAKEAGVSLGALRHYFSTQQELLSFAMQLVKDRVNDRIDAWIPMDLPPKEKIAKILLELVPVDDDKMAEMEVWFAFTFQRKYGEERFDALHDGLLDGMRNLVGYLRDTGLLRPELDPEEEAERLYALVDGLALHVMLDPARIGRERIVRLMAGHLDSICVP
ncbi:TetR/AcrR family transcriptional regulator [Cohnella caldifontis]|uniref:TetR/AcrR family transcriptional regulator n=1 Tax=Cohnella caldifontis TaxID=3027471 RepID=UPI0023ECDE86|nr:TetR/AcrR family transcriptional regulator [Cohnella sp. YIM B05605]